MLLSSPVFSQVKESTFPNEKVAKQWRRSWKIHQLGVGTEQAGTLMGNQSGNECSKVGHVATHNLAESICEARLQIMEKTGV